ncbi:MAG: hypothetical protein WCA60_08030 [Methanoregula sp.]
MKKRVRHAAKNARYEKKKAEVIKVTIQDRKKKLPENLDCGYIILNREV